MKNLLRALAGLGIIAAGVFLANFLIGLKEAPPVSAPPRPVKLVKTMPAELSSEAPRVYVQGRVRALDRIEVFSEVGGVILPQEKEFRTGVRFRKGEVLLKLDDSELRMSLIAQRSAFLQLLTGALADFKVDFSDRYETWRDYTASLNVEALLPVLPDPATDQEKFFLSNRGILNQYYTIRSSEERLAKFTLRAPFDGEVSNALVNPGALVRVGQKIGDFVSKNSFEIESAIPEDALRVVRVGDRFVSESSSGAAKAADANTNRLTGSVLRISETVDPNTQTAKVFLRVDADELRDGMYLGGRIEGQPIDSVLRIPLELLTPDERIYTVESDSILRAQNVEVIYRSQKDALVRGVKSGTQLVAEPVANANDGMAVKVTGK